MNAFVIALTSAFQLGILTSISPCPLATNLAAISYVGRNAGSASRVIFAGLLYTLRRVLVYIVLAALLVASVVSSPAISLWLQTNLNRFLGPLLIVVDMILLGLPSVELNGAGVSESLRQRVDRLGLAGAGLLGILFALSFCPASAALFFGSLLPLAVSTESTILVPAVYGVATGLPVFVFALLFTLGTKWVGAAFNRLSQAEWWIRQSTGAAILVIGCYLMLHYMWRVV